MELEITKCTLSIGYYSALINKYPIEHPCKKINKIGIIKLILSTIRLFLSNNFAGCSKAIMFEDVELFLNLAEDKI
jgi:hypothetical protein